MKLTCPDCRKPVSAADVNIKLGVGKCLACDAVFSLVDQVGLPMTGLRSKAAIAPSKNFRIDDFGPDLSISWSWYTHAIWFLVVFALIWNGFLVTWYTIAIRSYFDPAHGQHGSVGMLLFPVLHLLAGIGAAYVCLVTFCNRTEVCLRGGELTVTLGPLPTWGNRRVRAADIAQLFCSERCHRGKHSYSYSYSLNALLTSGERIDLVSNMTLATDALYLERAFEERLRIADQRVAGDWVG
jgi:hypothetical protein